MKKIIFIFLASFSIYPENFNSHGSLGYINVPSAFTLKENTYSLVLSKNDPIGRATLTLSPFDWLDASIFYVDIAGKEYGGGFKQSYKDKGFNIKFSPISFLDHKVALGFNDMAGTGLFQSEYIAFSKIDENFEYTFGIGWGAFNNGIVIDNPFIQFDDSFEIRSKEFKNQGGEFEIGDYFSGKNASVFFAAAYKLNQSTFIELELDPTNVMVPEIPYKKTNKKINIGITTNYKNLTLSAHLNRQDYFGFQVTYSKDMSNFNRDIKRKDFYKNMQNYKDLQMTLDLKNIGLKEISKTENALEVKVRHNSYFDQQKVDSIVAEHSRTYALESGLEEIIVKQYYQGMEMNVNSYTANMLAPTKYLSEENKETKYIVIDKYPIIRNKLYPSIRNYIAAREAFYFGGLFLENDTDLILSNNLFLISNLKYSVIDNFDDLYIEPINTYPAQVRTDNKDYMREFGDRVILGRLELNYFKSPRKNHYLRGSIGIFEEMFGGAGFDYVYSPQDSILSLGFEGYHLKKRDYSMRFSFQEFKNTLFRFSVQVQEPKTNVRAKLSFGEYIAGDRGYTFEVSRNFKNGVEFSAFFSRTDVTTAQFGEGSFDKGISIRVPITNLFGKESLARYVWRPLTKDPAALLIKSIDLMDEVDRFRFY